MGEKLDLNSPEFRMAVMAKHVRELMEKNEQLEQQLTEAEKVIEFYARLENWKNQTINTLPIFNILDDLELTDPYEDYCCRRGGRKAREYLAKKGSNEQRTSTQTLS